MPQPPFAAGRRWERRLSKRREIGRRVWYDPETDYEYESDPRPLRRTWHQVDPRSGRYRDIDPETGEPVAGSEGQWRPLR